MGKFEEVIKSEIARLARKATKGNLQYLTKNVRELKREVSRLSKAVTALKEQLARHAQHEIAEKGRLHAPVEEVKAARISPLLIKKLRKRLGITQDSLALLLGVSKGAVVSWESGRSAPRQAGKSALVALRKLGRRDIKKLLASKGKAKKKKARKRTAKRGRRRKK